MEYNITYRQKDKGWQYIISRKDENGKWKQVKSKQGFKTKNGDAKPAAEDALQDLKDSEKNQEAIIDEEYDTILFSSLYDLFIEHNMTYL